MRWLCPTVMLWLLGGAACSGRTPDNPFLDAGNGTKKRGESCSRNVQCEEPLVCVAFVCGDVPDAAGPPDAAVTTDGGADLDASAGD